LNFSNALMKYQVSCAMPEQVSLPLMPGQPVVALDRPVGQETGAFACRPALHGRRIRRGERFACAIVVDADHLGDADHGRLPFQVSYFPTIS
jgi:hypothetical protein